MRSSVAIIILLALALPSVAAAQVLSSEQAEELRVVSAHPAECARLRRQIAQYAAMHQRAVTLENALWSERLENHIEQLRAMQAARCPQDLPVDTAGQAFQEFLKLAAKGAVRYFTFGAAGF